MPVKFWYEDKDGTIRSRVITGWDKVYRGEEYRVEAEHLDTLIDGVLDAAVARADHPSVVAVSADQRFKVIWSFGRTVKDSGILRHRALATEQQTILWRAMAAKSRLGIRSGYPRVPRHEGWRILRGKREPDVTNRGGGVQDTFETALWMQQHDLVEAACLFGGKLGNAREIGCRRGINVPQVRHALLRWIQRLDDDVRRIIHVRRNFQQVAKALTARWPYRGSGSARRPEHLGPDELYRELSRALGPVLEQVSE